MKLSTLKKRAQSSTKRRGHRMQWNIASKTFGSGRCRDCGAACWLETKPAPNGIDISGLAVAVNCDSVN